MECIIILQLSKAAVMLLSCVCCCVCNDCGCSFGFFIHGFGVEICVDCCIACVSLHTIESPKDFVFDCL